MPLALTILLDYKDITVNTELLLTSLNKICELSRYCTNIYEYD